MAAVTATDIKLSLKLLTVFTDNTRYLSVDTGT